MTDIQEEAQDTPLVHEITSDEVNGPTTLAEQLRLRRSELAETHETTIPLTGYEEFGVHVRHRLMDRVEVEKIGRKVMRETKDRGERQMRILVDLIINSTRGFFIQPDGELEMHQILDDQRGEIPVMNWSMFADYLGWQAPNGDGDSRSALYWVFGGNEFMVGQHGINLNRWMNNTGLKIDEEFLGEVL